MKKLTVVYFTGADNKSYSIEYDKNHDCAFAIAFNKIMEFPDSIISNLDINDFFKIIGVKKKDRSDMLMALIQKQAIELKRKENEKSY